MSDWIDCINSDSPFNHFNEILRNCKVEYDGCKYVQKSSIQSVLKHLADLKSHVKQFDELRLNLTSIISDDYYFNLLLQPVLSTFDVYIFQSSKSIVQILLMINEIADFLIDILIERICELSSQADGDSDENVLKAKICLDQLKWSIYTRRMDDVVEKLLDLGYIANEAVQLHLITILPEICRGQCSNVLSNKLYEWISSRNSLISSALDAIGRLDLQQTFFQEIEPKLMDLLDTAEMSELPSIIGFLISHSSSNSSAYLFDLINRIRRNTELDNLQNMFSSVVSSTPINSAVKHNSAVALINSLKTQFQFKPKLQSIWLKSISTTIDGVCCQSFDFIMLLMLFANGFRRNSVMILMKTKVVKRLFDLNTIDRLFRFHLSLIRPYYRNLLAIMMGILNCDNGTVFDFVKNVFLQCLINPNCLFNDRNVFDRLLTELYIKSPTIIDGVVGVVEFLTESCTKSILKFHNEIAELLMKSSNLNSGQVYRMYNVLGRLVFAGSNVRDDNNTFIDSMDLKNDIGNLMRLQLQNSDFNIRRNGVIGALTVIRYLSNVADQQNSSFDAFEQLLFINNASSYLNTNTDENNELLYPNRRTASGILKMLLANSEFLPELSIVVFDELYLLLKRGQLDSVEMQISRMIAESFQDRFVLTLSSETDKFHRLFGLTESHNCDVGIKISCESSNNNSLIIGLPSHFRLYALSELKLHDSDLSEIRALLYCPLVCDLPFDQIGPLPLLIILNWFIELVNGFVGEKTQKNSQIHQLTMTKRLKLIVDLRRKLDSKLEHIDKSVYLPAIQPLVGLNLVQVTEVKSIVCVKRRRQKSKDGKSKKLKKTITNEETGLENEEEDLFSASTSNDGKVAVVSAKCKILTENVGFCIREIDIAVHVFIGYLNLSDLIVSDHPESLNWIDLRFYLNDLWLKVDYKLRVRSSFLTEYRTGIPMKNSILFRFLDEIAAENLTEKIVNLGVLFAKIIQSALGYTKDIAIYDNIGKICCEVLNLVFKIIKIVIHYLSKTPKESTEWSGKQMELFLHMLTNGKSHAGRDCVDSMIIILVSFKDDLPNIVTAASYVELLSELLSITKCQDVSMYDITKEFLSPKWSDVDPNSSSSFKNAVSVIYEMHLSSLNENFFDILMKDVIPEMENFINKDTIYDANSIIYGCLKKSTFMSFFSKTLDFILKRCKFCSKEQTTQRYSTQAVESWERIIGVIKFVTKIVADYDEPPVVLSFIKFSCNFMKIIIKYLMPIFDYLLRDERESVVRLLKSIQEVTRFMQRLCSHCKSKKIVSAASIVPQLRQSLETFMFRVKKMICLNKCAGDSINILLLANKDLHGKRIEESFDSDESDDESEPPENDGDNEEMEDYSD